MQAEKYSPMHYTPRKEIIKSDVTFELTFL